MCHCSSLLNAAVPCHLLKVRLFEGVGCKSVWFLVPVLCQLQTGLPTWSDAVVAACQMLLLQTLELLLKKAILPMLNQ